MGNHYRLYNREGELLEAFEADSDADAETYVEIEWPDNSQYIELWETSLLGERKKHVCVWHG